MDPEDYKKLTHKITLIPDKSNPYDGLYIAEYDEGNYLDLMHSGHGSGDVDALRMVRYQMA